MLRTFVPGRQRSTLKHLRALQVLLVPAKKQSFQMPARQLLDLSLAQWFLRSQWRERRKEEKMCDVILINFRLLPSHFFHKKKTPV